MKMHHEFRVSVSFCPNACSRPQIVDLGIIGAVRPAAISSECTFCNLCLDKCREEAIDLPSHGKPLIDYEKCLFCGHCTSVCQPSVLEREKEGFRVMVGGKLGRHPQLAYELPGIFVQEQVLDIAEKVVDFYRRRCAGGERLGVLVNRVGIKEFYRFLGLPYGKK